MDSFFEKIDNSIALIRRAERLALELDSEGFYLGFSGGKDSQVLLDLVKRANVKYRAYYNVTTNDPPISVYFIRQYYPDVAFSLPKRNFFKIVAHKGLPTRLHRMCCVELKESNGAGRVVLTGVRAQESKTREKYNDLQVYSHRKEHRDRSQMRTLDEIEENEHKCIKGKDKLMVRPILQWSTQDIWRYIRENNLPINPVYYQFDRVGCMFCPFSSKREMLYWSKQYPKFKQQLIRSLQMFLDKNEKNVFVDAEECFEWWVSKDDVETFFEKKSQLAMEFQ